jgi:hypothetical protein
MTRPGLTAASGSAALGELLRLAPRRHASLVALGAIVLTMLQPGIAHADTAPSIANQVQAGQEIPSLRTRYASTFAGQASGTFDSVIHAKPIHYQDGSGAWQDIDTSLVPGAGGTLNEAANDLSLQINPAASNGAKLVHLGLADGQSLGWGLAGSLALPTATTQGSSIALTGVLSGTTLQLTAQAEGVKENLVLASPLSPRSFTFPLYLQGLTASLDGEGNLIYRDGGGVERARMPHGWMYDSKVDPQSDEPAQSGGVTYTLLSGGPTGTQLRVSLDDAWLSDPARQWPVTVDPTATTSTYHGDSDDTYVQQPYTNDYSTDTILKSGTFDSGTDKARSFIHFSGINALDGKVINSATVKVFENWSYSCTAEPVNLYQVTQSWTGSGLHSYPGWSLGSLIDQVSAAHGYTSCPTGAYVNFDALTAMRNWANNSWANYGVALVAPSETNNYEWKKWDSVQGTNDPEIVVNWQNPDTAPGQVSGRSVSGNTCGTCTTPITADTTPNLTGSGTDPDADTIEYFFEVYPGTLTTVDASGNATVSGVTAAATGHTAFQASGSIGTWTTSPALADGKYSYRVRAYDGQLYGVWSKGWVNFTVDSTGPTPTVSSSTHPNQSTWTSNNAPVLTWSASSESGIQGYSYVLDQSSATVPDTTSEGTGTTTSYSGLADGTWYFHVRAENNANVWGGTSTYTLKIDVTAPSSPLTVTSTSHTPGVPSPNRNIAMSWSAGSDSTAGVAGYSIAFNNSATAPADGTVDVMDPTTTATSAALNDGTWYFHVRTIDRAGNMSADVTAGPYLVDGTGPSSPSITCADHDQTTWSTDRSAHCAWTQTDGSTIAGYSVAFDQSPSSDPPATVNATLPTWTRDNDIPDGAWYLHVRAQDAAGNWGATGTFAIHVDATAPASPQVSSSTHPDQASTYDNAAPAFSWTASDVSPIVGYSYTFDQTATTDPDTTSEGAATATSYSGVDNGIYYFHVRAENAAGLWGPTATFQITNWILADAQPGDFNSSTPASGPVPDALPVDPTALVPAPGTGLGPLYPLANRLGHLLPTGGLLGADAFFGGDVLPSRNIAGDTMHGFGALLPPTLARPNVGGTVNSVLGQLGRAPSLNPYFSMIRSLTYQVDTTPYDANGQPGSTTTFALPVCVPTAFNAANGLAAVPATYNLRVNFCPDASSFDPTDPSNQQMRQERATYQLDALATGVRAKVQITFLVNGQQIRLVTDARNMDQPADTGSGAAIGSDYPCANASITAPSALTGLVLPTDTRDGYCLELTAQPHADNSQTVTMTSSTSGRLDNEQLFVDANVGNSFTPLDHVTVSPVVVSDHHRYELTALSTSTADRLEMSLTDTASNTGEQLALEQYDTQTGKVALNLQLTNVPTNFATTLDATLDGSGNISGANISGAQPVMPTESLLVQQNDANGNPQNTLRVSSFAADYRYHLEPLRDSNGTEIGAYTTAHFGSGTPAGGRLRLEQYSNSNLTGRLDEYAFAPDSTFRITATGDPNNPTGAVVDTTNSAPVDNQLIQVLSYPSSGAAQRLVLAGTNAPSTLLSAPVDGSNLRWDAPPQNEHTEFSEALQPNNGQPGANTPGHLEISGTASPTPSAASHITATLQSGASVQGLVLVAPSSNHSLQIDVTGDASNLSHFRIARDNNTARPEQALQIFQQDATGLHTQVKFLGISGNTAGLVTGTADEVNGAATNMADDYSLDVQLTTSGGHPTDAVISGTNNAAAPDEDITLADSVVGFTAHLHSLQPSYTYKVHAGNFDGNGNPTSASISAESQTADNPNGLIDLTYGRFRYLTQSLSRTFTDTIQAAGPLTQPTRITLSRSQSGANPNQLIQLMVLSPSGARQLVMSLVDGQAVPVVNEQGSYADLVWTGVPSNFTLDLGRTTTSNGGGASVEATLGADAPEADLTLRQVCAAGRQNCSGASVQSLHAHGMSTDWHFDTSYSGNSSDPTSIHVGATANLRHAGDVLELLNYSSNALTERLALHQPGVSITGPTPTQANADWNAVPGTFNLDYSRSPDGQQPVVQSVAGSSDGDAPTSEFQATQTDGDGSQQQIVMHGLAPSWSVTANRRGSGADPSAMHLGTTSSFRHDTDYLQGLAYDANGTLQQQFELAGSSTNLPLLRPAIGSFRYTGGYPAGLTLDYHRTKNADGSDKHFDLALTNLDAAGNPSVPDPASTVIAQLNSQGSPSEQLTLTRLPQQITKLSYDLPSLGAPADATVNCLGTIDYGATDSTMILSLVQDRRSTCLNDQIRATVTGMPSLGFGSTVVRPDGSAEFATRTDANGNYQEVPSVSLDLPVPSMAANFVNRPVNLDDQFCPEVTFHAGCTHATITTDNLSFYKLRLHLDAFRLTHATVATNMQAAQNDWRPNAGDATDASIRDALWKTLPIFAVKNDSSGAINVRLTGKVLHDATLSQHVDCCVKQLPTAHFSSTLSLPADTPLAMRFYGWTAKAGLSCTDPNGGGTQYLLRCNSANQELDYSFGQMFHFHEPNAVPFDPAYDASNYDGQSGSFSSQPNSVSYYVPDLYDAFLSEAPGQGLWWAHNGLGWSTDWLWESLLREYPQDPLGLVS